MEKMKSTCKVYDVYGVEIGKYAIALEGGVVLSKPLPGSRKKLDVVPDDTGEVEVSEATTAKAEMLNRQLSQIVDMKRKTGLPVDTAFEEYDGADPDD